MNRKTVMTALGGLVLVTAFTGSANAGCGFEPGHEKKAVFKTAAFKLVDNDQDKIVGMWKVQFLVGRTSSISATANGTAMERKS